jgi:predicted ATP-grasp superfamily ATP-dependent carboligase
MSARGITVIGVAKDKYHYCCRTKVLEHLFEADTSTDEFIRRLEQLGPTLPNKPVLIPCSDMSVRLTSQHRRKLEPWFHMALPPQDVVELLMNKVNFYTYAHENNIPIPRTAIMHSRAEARRAANTFRYPCVVKPPLSATPRWEQSSKLKAYKVSTQADVMRIFDRYIELAGTLILQEWVVGPQANTYTGYCYIDRRSEPVVTFVSRKLRQWPPQTGEGSFAQECRNESVAQAMLHLFGSVSFHGFGYLEMKQDERTGEYLIIEPNIGRPTNSKWGMAEMSGLELMYTMYCDSLGWRLPQARSQRYRDVKWVFLRKDLQSMIYLRRRGLLSPLAWLNSLRGPKVYALWSLRDPGPFIADLVRSVRLYLSPEERRKRDYSNSLD